MNDRNEIESDTDLLGWPAATCESVMVLHNDILFVFVVSRKTNSIIDFGCRIFAKNKFDEL